MTKDEERFWSKVDRRGPGECWEWIAGRCRAGYGYVQWEGRLQSAHRVAWQLAHGPIPEGLHVLHHCDNPGCVNAVGHLFLGTNAENMADRDAKGRQAKSDRHGSHTHPERWPRGEAHVRSKVTTADVRLIRALRASGVPRVDVARRFGLTAASIYRICLRKTWAHVPEEKT